MAVKIKICGMKYPENIEEIALLQPDFLGFIFYENSPRNKKNNIPTLDKAIQKVGVFVNASYDEIEAIVKQHELNLVQLHGDETPELCQEVENNLAKVIKAFSIDKQFNFNILNTYNKSCTYFLFDTKGDHYGGNGFTFDWTILANYHLDKSYFLSGGIGLENTNEVKEFLSQNYAKNCVAIDCNSQLEISPGLKSIEKTKQLIHTFKK